MGTCLSKKTSSSSTSITTTTTTTSKPAVVAAPPPEPIPKPEPEEQKKITHVEAVESVKEIFVIKQRKSHERQRPEERVSNAKAEDSFSADPPTTNIASAPLTGSTSVPLRTSSCTKEEVDAILIQCGRLSRSSSSKGGGGGSGKYSGSKRSYDFDQDNDSAAAADKKSSDEDRRHHSRPSHRRTPSREKDVEYKRSSSRDRSSSSREEERRRGGGSGGSRRTSRSPGRRSETPSAPTVSASSAAAAAADKSKPGKIVSVPASVSSNRDNKLINGGSAAAVVPDSAAVTVVKRVSVKRNSEAGGFRGTASPRSQSPAYSRPNNNSNGECAQHHLQPSLSRNSSRKAEHSPYRRNPMSEIDENCPRSKEQPTLKPQDHIDTTNKVVVPGLNSKMQMCKEGEELKALPLQNQAAEQQQRVAATEDRPTEVKGLLPLKTSETALPTAAAENLVPPQATITRSRSSRRSRDLDLNLGFNPDTLLNPTSYASLLLEDIQNFHQQQNTCTAAAVAAFSLPPCVTKARSILEAVADLNSCTSSNLSSVVFSEERSSEAADWSNNRNTKNAAAASNPNLGKKRLEVKDRFVESEVVVNNDINEPSLHKYVTVRRGMMGGGGEGEQQQESSGSNSFVGGQHWAAAASSWETNSVESTWTSRSNTNTGEESVIVVEKESKPIESENQIAVAHDIVEAIVVDARRNSRINGSRSTQLPSMNPSGKRRELQHHQHVKAQQGKVSRAIPVAASASL